MLLRMLRTVNFRISSVYVVDVYSSCCLEIIDNSLINLYLRLLLRFHITLLFSITKLTIQVQTGIYWNSSPQYSTQISHTIMYILRISIFFPIFNRIFIIINERLCSSTSRQIPFYAISPQLVILIWIEYDTISISFKD